MIKIKPIIFNAAAAFVFSFFTALCAKSGLPIALLKALIFAVIFGGLAVGVQVLYGMFLSDGGAAPQETQEEQKAVGTKVDLVVSEEDLPDDKDAPAFFVDGRRVVTDDDVGGAKGSPAFQDVSDGGAINAAQQNEALAAAEKVRETKAAENIEKKAQEISQANADAKASAAEEAKPAFAPIDLAAKPQPAQVNEESVPEAVSSGDEASKAASAKSGDPELDELPDIIGFGGGGGEAAGSAPAQEDVIEDSEFAQDGSVKVHRQTELADGKIADVKDAPVMAEAIRTILSKEE